MDGEAGAGAREQRSADGVFSGGGIKGLAFAGALAGAGSGGVHEMARGGRDLGGGDHGDGAGRRLRRRRAEALARHL